jgi:hypothetical protein
MEERLGVMFHPVSDEMTPAKLQDEHSQPRSNLPTNLHDHNEIDWQDQMTVFPFNCLPLAVVGILAQEENIIGLLQFMDSRDSW